MKDKLVGLDTNIFIYYLQQDLHFGIPAKAIFAQLTASKIKAVTSIITLAEVLSYKQSDKESEVLKDFLLEIPNVRFVDIGSDIGLEAARIRREYGFRLPDAMQLATCLIEKADMFVTNDHRLKTFKELPIAFLDKNTPLKA